MVEHCSHQQEREDVSVLTSAVRNQIIARNKQFTDRGLWVLGLAYKPMVNRPENSLTEIEAEQHLVWLGLVGLVKTPSN